MSSPRSLEGFQDEFARLRNDWAEWRKETIESERAGAPRHNLIELVRLQHSEVRLHSPFLCDLLNPYGTHGQGVLFLRNFLRMIDEKRPDKEPLHLRVRDQPDPSVWDVVCERERIDIRVCSLRARIAVFIENKIYAGEQENQITRYRRILDRYSPAYSDRILIGITPLEYRFDTGEPEIKLKYEKDIFNWLEETSKRIPEQAVKLRGNIEQYRQVVRSFSDKKAMTEQGLIDIIAKPENLQCALEISNAMQAARNCLRRKFWRAVADVLEDALSAAETRPAGWKVVGLDEMCRDPEKGYVGLSLEGPPSPTDGNHLRVGVWQEPSCLNCGIAYRKTLVGQEALPNQIKSLQQELSEEMRFEPADCDWVGWYSPGYNTDTPEFLLEAARNADGLAKSVSHPLTQMLSKSSFWDRLVDADDALRGMKA